MKTYLRLLWCAALLALFPVFAQAAGSFIDKIFPALPPTDDNQVAGMIYIPAVTGHVECAADRIFDLQKGDKVPGRGTIIRTDANSTATLLFSNGSTMILMAKSEIKVEKFDQEPFTPNNNLLIEPSNSQLFIYVRAGSLVVSTKQLLSGSRFVFDTPHAAVSILNNQSGGEKGSLDVTAGQTHFVMILGNARVKVRNADGTLGAIGTEVPAAHAATVLYAWSGSAHDKDNDSGARLAVVAGGDNPLPDSASVSAANSNAANAAAGASASATTPATAAGAAAATLAESHLLAASAADVDHPGSPR